MNKSFINLIIIIFTLISFNKLHSFENKILFKINDSLITTIDFENRKKYLLFVGDNQNLDEKEILEDLIIAAINDAKQKGENAAQEQMKSLTGGLPLPPGMKLPF